MVYNLSPPVLHSAVFPDTQMVDAKLHPLSFKGWVTEQYWINIEDEQNHCNSVSLSDCRTKREFRHLTQLLIGQLSYLSPGLQREQERGISRGAVLS